MNRSSAIFETEIDIDSPIRLSQNVSQSMAFSVFSIPEGDQNQIHNEILKKQKLLESLKTEYEVLLKASRINKQFVKQKQLQVEINQIQKSVQVLYRGLLQIEKQSYQLVLKRSKISLNILRGRYLKLLQEDNKQSKNYKNAYEISNQADLYKKDQQSKMKYYKDYIAEARQHYTDELKDKVDILRELAKLKEVYKRQRLQQAQQKRYQQVLKNETRLKFRKKLLKCVMSQWKDYNLYKKLQDSKFRLKKIKNATKEKDIKLCIQKFNDMLLMNSSLTNKSQELMNNLKALNYQERLLREELTKIQEQESKEFEGVIKKEQMISCLRYDDLYQKITRTNLIEYKLRQAYSWFFQYLNGIRLILDKFNQIDTNQIFGPSCSHLLEAIQAYSLENVENIQMILDTKSQQLIEIVLLLDFKIDNLMVICAQNYIYQTILDPRKYPMLKLQQKKLFYIGTKLPKLTRTRSILDVFDVDVNQKTVETIKNRVLATHFLEIEYLPTTNFNVYDVVSGSVQVQEQTKAMWIQSYHDRGQKHSRANQSLSKTTQGYDTDLRSKKEILEIIAENERIQIELEGGTLPKRLAVPKQKQKLAKTPKLPRIEQNILSLTSRTNRVARLSSHPSESWHNLHSEIAEKKQPLFRKLINKRDLRLPNLNGTKSHPIFSNKNRNLNK